jgi:integrase
MLKQQAYFNFEHSINSEHTKKTYVYCLEQFLTYCKLELAEFLLLDNSQQSNIIIQYLVQKKVSVRYKCIILATIKHACDMNDVLGINWKKIKKFIGSSKTGNEIVGKDRGYTHQEISKILQCSDQRMKTCFLILASTGIRIGALGLLKVGDLEPIQDLYKVRVYSGDKEQYLTFCTPEARKEIDTYLEYRTRKGEIITQDSYLIVQRFGKGESIGCPFKGYSLRSVLQDTIERTGIRTFGNKFKRKETALLHSFRKFFTKQLVDSNVKGEIIRRLNGWDSGLMTRYFKPEEPEILTEYLKAVPLLTISDEERLKFKLEERIKIEKTRMESMEETMKKLQQTVDSLKRRKRK